MLIMDGHSSHYSFELLQFCISCNIVVLCYPAHCTHTLQGLDVVCFAKMKRIWHASLDRFLNLNKRGINKDEFATVFGLAYIEAFDAETVQTAFRVTGVHPYNTSVINPQQMKPSEVSSLKTTFPLPLPSPVRRVMAAFHHQQATEMDIDPDTHIPLRTPSSADFQTPPTSPTRSRSQSNTTINPDLFTPTKCVPLLIRSFADAESGSFLIAKPTVDSSWLNIVPVIESTPLELAEPDWDSIAAQSSNLSQLSRASLEGRVEKLASNLASARAHVHVQRDIIESANAQLVVQQIQGERMNLAILEKPKKKKKRAKFNSDGLGRVATKAEVIKALQKEEEETHQRENEKTT